MFNGVVKQILRAINKLGKEVVSSDLYERECE